jgi:hypothetical protein
MSLNPAPTLRENLLIVLFAVSVAVGVTWIAERAGGAQEKDPSYPRSWRMKSGPSFLDLDVDIIETAGVCLYLVKSGGVYGGYTIAAVAKTQLPRGVGCQ